MKKLFAVIFLLLGFVLANPVASQAATISVNPSANLQSVLDSASSGDTILFDDGTYYQSVIVKKPLTLKARNGGRAILSGSHNGNFNFSADGSTSGLFTANVSWSVSWVTGNNRLLLNYKNLNSLKNFTFPDTGKPGPKEGFYYDSGSQRLYLRLQNNANPNNAKIEVNNNVGGVGITVQADNVTIEGLVLRHWRRQAIITNYPRRNIYVRHNYFQNNKTGFQTVGWGPSHQGFYIENNEFSTYPVYQIRLPGGYEIWQGLYNTNLNTVGIHAYTNGIYIRNNYIYEMFDGVQILGWQNYTSATDLVSEVSNNVIHNMVDNPIEIDPINVIVNARVHHNFIFDSYTMISMTSFQYGKLMVDHNIFYSSPQFGINSAWVKTKLNPQANQSLPAKNMTVAHNTVVLRYSDSTGSKFYTDGSEDATYSNSKFQNNIVMVQEINGNTPYELTKGEGFKFLSENIIFGSKIASSTLTNAIHQQPGFISTSPQIDFHLSRSGVAVGTGANRDGEYYHSTRDGSTDLGAIEFGSSWSMPKPGPSWATNNTIINRPSLPSTLIVSFTGLNSSGTTPTPSLGVTNTPTPNVSSVRGDANGDRIVNEADYTIWSGNYKAATSNGASDGDFNNDGQVNGIDYVIWLSNVN